MEKLLKKLGYKSIHNTKGFATYESDKSTAIKMDFFWRFYLKGESEPALEFPDMDGNVDKETIDQLTLINSKTKA